MRVLDPGHDYELNCLDTKGVELSHRLTFVKRQGFNYPGNEGEYPGTTCQEVLRALIDRCRYIQDQKPCFETFLIIRLMVFTLWLFELRHGRRNGYIPGLWGVESKEVCPICGHVCCLSNHKNSADRHQI